MTTIHFYDHIRLRSLDRSDAPDAEGDDLSIRIVPAYEADVASGRISADAPVGKAVLHRRLGDTVTVLAQGRRIPMKIIEVEKHDTLQLHGE